jgi:hypothetical protein
MAAMSRRAPSYTAASASFLSPMAQIHLIDLTPEIAKRRSALPPGTLVEAWPDLTQPGVVWVDDETKQVLDSVGAPLRPRLSIDGDWIRIYYGPRLRDVGSLPREGSLRARVLSAHGLAVAWATIDERGDRVDHEAAGASDPIFYLRRPRTDAAHVWRLFRTKRDAVAFVEARFADDREARQWAQGLPVDDFQSLIDRAATGGGAPGASP